MLFDRGYRELLSYFVFLIRLRALSWHKDEMRWAFETDHRFLKVRMSLTGGLGGPGGKKSGHDHHIILVILAK